MRFDPERIRRIMDEETGVVPRSSTPQVTPQDTQQVGKRKRFDPERIQMIMDEIAPLPAERTFGGTMKDIGISALKGAVALPEAIQGIADIATGGRVGKFTEKLGYKPQETQRILDKQFSPAQQEANRYVDEAEGFTGTLKAMVEKPSTIGHSVIQSLPLMVGGQGLARVGMKAAPKFFTGNAAGTAAKVSPKYIGRQLAASAAGEGVIAAGATEESIRSQTEDGLTTPKQSAMAALSGFGTGIFTLAGGRLAQKLGFGDIDSMLAGISTKKGKKGIADIAKNIIGGGISEGAFEEMPQSIQEVIWENAALDRPLLEGTGEAAAQGLLTGAAMGSGANVLSMAAPSVAEQPKPEPKLPTPPLTPDLSTLPTPRSVGDIPDFPGPDPIATMDIRQSNTDDLFNEMADGQGRLQLEDDARTWKKKYERYEPELPEGIKTKEHSKGSRFTITGSTEEQNKALEELGGRWNNTANGYTFPGARREEITDQLNSLFKGEQNDNTGTAPQESTETAGRMVEGQGLQQPGMSEPGYDKSAISELSPEARTGAERADGILEAAGRGQGEDGLSQRLYSDRLELGNLGELPEAAGRGTAEGSGIEQGSPVQDIREPINNRTGQQDATPDSRAGDDAAPSETSKETWQVNRAEYAKKSISRASRLLDKIDKVKGEIISLMGVGAGEVKGQGFGGANFSSPRNDINQKERVREKYGANQQQDKKQKELQNLIRLYELARTAKDSKLAQHREFVLDAVQKGKDIPSEVFDEYPDIFGEGQDGREAVESLTPQENQFLGFLESDAKQGRVMIPNEKNRPVYDSLVKKGFAVKNGDRYEIAKTDDGARQRERDNGAESGRERRGATGLDKPVQDGQDATENDGGSRQDAMAAQPRPTAPTERTVEPAGNMADNAAQSADTGQLAAKTRTDKPGTTNGKVEIGALASYGEFKKKLDASLYATTNVLSSSQNANAVHYRKMFESIPISDGVSLLEQAEQHEEFHPDTIKQYRKILQARQQSAPSAVTEGRAGIPAPGMETEALRPVAVNDPSGEPQGVYSKEPWQMTREENADVFPGDEYDKMINRAADVGNISYKDAEKLSRIDYQGNKYFWAKTKKDLEDDKKAAIKSAKGERASINKMKSSSGYAKWRIKSKSNTAKNNIESTRKQHEGLAEVHKERIQEAITEGKPVPPEVLADYPGLAKLAASTAPALPQGIGLESADVQQQGIAPRKTEREGNRQAVDISSEGLAYRSRSITNKPTQVSTVGTGQAGTAAPVSKEPFAVPRQNHRDFKNGEWKFPRSRKVPLYHETNSSPEEIISGGIKNKGNGVFALQAPQATEDDYARGVGRRYIVEFEADFSKEKQPIYQASGSRYPEVAYENPEWNTQNFTEINYKGIWKGDEDIPADAITLIYDNKEGKVVYRKGESGTTTATNPSVTEKTPGNKADVTVQKSSDKDAETSEALEPQPTDTAKAIYSKLSRVSALNFTGMKAQGVLNFLNKNGVKKAEIEATGLDAWISGKKPADKVSREELLGFVQANMVEVEDVVLGGDQYYRDKNGNKVLDEETGGFVEAINRPHFFQYTEPNADEGSYREMFVTAPKDSPDSLRVVKHPTSSGQWAIQKADGGYILSARGPVAAWDSEAQAKVNGIPYHDSTKWFDGHSQYAEIDNPIVRVRFNTETKNGKTNLRIEEMQGPSDANQQKMPKYLRENIYNLGVKRILAHAKEHGYDGVTFATKPGMSAGETQEARYNLSERMVGGRTINSLNGTASEISDLLGRYTETVQPFNGASASSFITTGFDSTTRERFRDATSVDPEKVGNFIKSDAFASHGFSGFDVPSQRLMASGVLGMLHNRQVLDAVVRLVPVDVMDGFSRKEFSAKMSLHNEAMLESKSPVDALNDIAFGVNVSAEDVVRVVAFLSTVDATILGELNSGRISLKDLAATWTDKGDFPSPGGLVAGHAGFSPGVFQLSPTFTKSLIHNISPFKDSERLINYIPKNRGSQGLKQLYDNQLPKMLEAYGKEKMADGVLPITDKTPGAFPLFSLDKQTGKATGKRRETTLSAILNQAKKAPGTTGQLANFLSSFIPASKLDIKVIIDPSARTAMYQGGDINTITLKDPTRYATALHEMVHAITVREMNSNEELRDAVISLMAKVKRKAIKEALITPAQAKLLETAKTSKDYKTNLEGAFKYDEIAYGFLNEKEFLSQAISSPQFQKLLQSTKVVYKGVIRNGWDAFVEMVMKSLGIKNTHQNAFGESLKLIAQFASQEKVNEFAQGENESLKTAMDRIQNLPAFKKWFGDSIVTVDGKAGSEPLEINGMFVKSDTPPPKKPKGYKTGLKLRERLMDGNDSISNEDIIEKAWEESPDIIGPWTNLPGPYTDREEAGEREMFLSGLLGLTEPQLVIARRLGNVPESGYSWNKADNKYEDGISVVDVLSPENQYREYWQYDGLLSNRENTWIWGYLLDQDIFYGGDGEALLVGAKALSKANTPDVKSIFNRGTWNPTNPDINESPETFEALEPFVGVKTKAQQLADKYLPEDKRERLATYLWDQNAPIARVQREIGKVVESEDYNLITRLSGKRVADETKQFWQKELEPLLQFMADNKVKTEQVHDLAWAQHAPERNLQMRRVNARRYIDSMMQYMTDGQKGKYLGGLGNIQNEFVMNDQTRNQKRDGYLKLLDEIIADIEKRDTEVEERQQELNSREFTEEEQEKGTKEYLQGRIDNERKRIAEQRKINNQWVSVKDRLSGMTDNEAFDSIEKLKKEKNFDSIQKAVVDFRKIGSDGLEMNYLAGEYTKEEYEAIKGTYKYHVPLMREDMEDTKSPSGRQGIGPLAKPIKIASGSTKNVVNIIGNIVDRRQSAISRKHKLEAGKVLYNMVKNNPDESRWSIGEQDKSPYYDSEGNIRMYVDHILPDNEVYVKVDGVRHIIHVEKDNKPMMRWMEALKREPVELGPILEASRKVTRFLAQLNTSLSPEFIISNFARDIQTAMVHLEDSEAAGMQKKVMKNVKAAIKGIYKAEMEQDAGEWGEIYRDFAKNGGKIGWIQGYENVEDLAKQIESELEYKEGKKPKREKFRKVMKFVESMNVAVENGVRLATYKAMVDAGLSKAKAARTAANLTVDFTRHGTVGPVANSLFMFANAGIVGNVRVLRALATNKKVQKIAGGIFGTGFAVSMIGAFLGGDDEDGESYYDKLLRTNPSLFERNMIFMLPGGRYVKIPMPYGYNAIYVMGNETARAIRGGTGYSVAEGMARIGGTLMGTLNPLGSATLLQTLAPTVVDPIAQVFENKAWHGGDLMPGKNPFGMPEPDSERYFKSVNPIAKVAAKWMNQLTGGSAIKSGLIDISPETIEMIFETATGSLGRLAKDATSLPITLISGEEITTNKVPFIRKVYGDKNDYADSQLYRQNRDSVLELEKEIKLSDPSKRRELRADDRFRLIASVKKSESRIRKMRQRLKIAEQRGNGEMVERIKDNMNREYMLFNTTYNKVVS